MRVGENAAAESGTEYNKRKRRKENEDFSTERKSEKG